MPDKDASINLSIKGVDEIEKQFGKIEGFYKQLQKRGGKVADDAKHLLTQQKLQFKLQVSQIEGIRKRYEKAEGDEKERIGRTLKEKILRTEMLGGKAETAFRQAGGPGGARGGVSRFMGGLLGKVPGGKFLTQEGRAAGGGGMAMLGGGLIAGLIALASTAKKASDMFVKLITAQEDFARSITSEAGDIGLFKSIEAGISTRMAKLGFTDIQSVQFAGQIAGIGGTRGPTTAGQLRNLREDVVSGGRLTRRFGISAQQGMGLVGGARRAGLGGEGIGDFLSAIGERARGGAPALQGRIPEFLQQAVGYLQGISTTLDKTEKKSAIDMFTRVMGGLAKEGAEFTGAGMQKLFKSVDQVMQSGKGIIGGTFGRFLTQNILGRGGTSFEVVRALEKGITVQGGKPFQDMIRQMTKGEGQLEAVANILKTETGGSLNEMVKFLEKILELDLSKETDFKTLEAEAKKIDPSGMAARLREAQAKQTNAMLLFGKSVPIFRQASIAMGDVAGLLLKEEREKFMQRFTGPRGVDPESMRVLKSIGQRTSYEMFGDELSMSLALAKKAGKIFREKEGMTSTGQLKVRFTQSETKIIAEAMGLGKASELRGNEMFIEMVDSFRKFLIERTDVQPSKMEITFTDEDLQTLTKKDVAMDKKP